MSRIGNYELIRLIAEGGFGRTYEAKEIYCPKIKACLKQNINLTNDDVQMLSKEAELMAQVHHHSLPAYRSFFPAPDGSHILAMQFIEGKTLEHSVKKHGCIEPEAISWVTQRLLNALYYLHGHGIVHGDVKPNNIIVLPAEHNAVLLDYGLSSIKPKATTKAEGYTTIFAAPEIMGGKPPLPESDLHSLGLTMIYALGGDPVTRGMPEHVPAKLAGYFRELAQHDPLQRPSWEKGDLVARLSDIRLEIFGSRQSVK